MKMSDHDNRPDWGWYFEKAGLSTSQGATASAEEHFKEISLEESLVREMAQNSLDAKGKDNQGPVRMSIDLRWVKESEIPDFETLKQHIEAAYESNREQENERLKDTKEASKETVFPVLRIGDYGTTGLTGSEDDNETNPPIVALTRSRGVSSGKRGKGGSFGLGATTGALASSISTVLWTTRTAESDEVIFAGQSQLATHQLGNNRFGPDGFYLDRNRRDNFHYLRTSDGWSSFPTRTEPGTDTYILGYLKADADSQLTKIRSAFVKHFLVAIHRGFLEVDCTVNDSKIWYLDKHSLEAYAADDPEVYPFYRALLKDPVIDSIPGLGQVSLYLYFDDSLDKTMNTIVMRKPLMRVRTYRHRVVPEKYAGIFICESDEGNDLLRKMEPPAHNNWTSERVPRGSTTIRKIKEFIRDKLLERRPKNQGEEIEISGLKELLPSGLGNDLFDDANDGFTTKPEDPGTEESATVHGGKPGPFSTSRQPRKKAMVSVEVPAQPNEEGQDEASTPGPNSGSGDGGSSKHRSPGAQKGDRGKGDSELLNPLLTMRSWQDTNSNQLTAVLRSSSPAHGNIRLVAKNGNGEEEKGYILPIASVSQILDDGERDLKFSKNFILGVEIPEDTLKATLRIKFKSNHRFLLELK